MPAGRTRQSEAKNLICHRGTENTESNGDKGGKFRRERQHKGAPGRKFPCMQEPASKMPALRYAGCACQRGLLGYNPRRHGKEESKEGFPKKQKLAESERRESREVAEARRDVD